ncbi:hypothetical protein F5883DRAFT_688691 [Diaporthe sp. PMI_573]|nr:hypothetical protein F5883DRAFT_688691 [Diaporthaceae sp. PMI_573]
MRQDIRGFFEDNYEDIFRVWISLLKGTTLLYDATSSDRRVIDALTAINNVFENPNTPYIFLRLAYFRFNDMIKTLKVITHNDRRSGLIHTAVGHRDASKAVDIYPGSQRQPLGRTESLRRIRHAKRWACLIGSSPLLLAICADKAEKLM